MSDCPDIGLFDALADGQLDPAMTLELRAHLSTCAECRQRDHRRLENNRLLGALREVLGSGNSNPVDSLVGKRVGAYQVIGVLGRGGMATVYEATQEHPRRSVALKLMNQSLSSSASLRRFELEAEILGRLQHDGIARIYEAGFAEVIVDARRAANDRDDFCSTHKTTDARAVVARVPFFAMELIRGQRLTDFAHSMRLDTRERLELIIKVCHAVQFAHQKGVIHRDLKPGNILVVDESSIADADQWSASPQSRASRLAVAPTGLRASIKILDFGVARATGVDQCAVTKCTDVGQIIGTLAYMSPEQAAGDTAMLDTRSDIYALGVVTFELLSGRLPIEIRGRLLPDAVRAIRDDPPQRLGAILSPLRGDVETIVAKALEKDPQRRYASAAALADDIERFLSGRPISARSASVVYQVRRFAARNKALVGGAAATLAALIVGLAGTLYGLVEATAQRNAAIEAGLRAEQGRLEAERRRSEAEALTGLLTQLLGSANPHEVKGRQYTVLQLLDDFERTFDAQLQNQPEVEASIRSTVGNAYRFLGDYPSAERHLKRAHELIAARCGPMDDRTLRSRVDLAWLLHDQARYDEAAAELNDVLRIRRAVLGSEHAEVASTMNALADVLRHPGRRDEAEPLLRAALEMRRRLLGDHHPDVAESLANLAKLLRESGQYESAETTIIDAMNIWRAVYGPEHPLLVDALNEQTWIAFVRGDVRRAENIGRSAVAMGRKLLGNNHPDLGNSLYSVALCLRARRDFAEAENLMREALAIYRRAHGDIHPSVATALDSLGLILNSKGDYAAAEPLLREALATRTSLFGDEHPETLSSLGNVAAFLRARGKLDEAEELFRAIVDRRRRRNGDAHPETAFAIAGLAGIRRMRGDSKTAESGYREALAIARQRLDANHMFIATCLSNLGQIAVEQHRLVEAETLLRDALSVARGRGAGERAETLSIAHHLAMLLIQTQRFSECDRLLADLMPLAQDGPRDRRLTRFLTDYGICLRELARLSDAQTLLLEALEISRESLGDRNEHTRAAARELQSVYEQMSEPEKAAALNDLLASTQPAARSTDARP